MDAVEANNTKVTISPMEEAMGQAILSGSTSNFRQIRMSAHMKIPKMADEKEADTMELEVM